MTNIVFLDPYVAAVLCVEVLGKTEFCLFWFSFFVRITFLFITVLLLVIPPFLHSASFQTGVHNLFLQLVNHCKST